MNKPFFQSLVITAVISIVCVLIPNPNSSLELSNHFTMAALFFLIVGIFLCILSSGFFDFFLYSVQSVQKLLRKKAEKMTLYTPEQGFSKKLSIKKITSTLLWTAGELLLLAVAIYWIWA